MLVSLFPHYKKWLTKKKENKMKKFLEKDDSYYRIPLESSTVYFSHDVKVKPEEYIDITIKDMVYKIDEIIKSLKEKIEHSASYLGLISEGVKKITEVVKEEVKSQFNNIFGTLKSLNKAVRK